MKKLALVLALLFALSLLAGCGYSKSDLAEAKRAGYDSGYDKGYSDGYEAGYDEGRFDGYLRAEEEVGSLYDDAEFSMGSADEYLMIALTMLDTPEDHTIQDLIDVIEKARDYLAN